MQRSLSWRAEVGDLQAATPNHQFFEGPRSVFLLASVTKIDGKKKYVFPTKNCLIFGRWNDGLENCIGVNVMLNVQLADCFF